MDWTILSFLGATGIIIVGSVLQASTGIGAGLIIVPVLALISQNLIPVPIIIASIFLSSIMLLQEYKHVQIFGMSKIILGLMFGTLIASTLLANIPLQFMGIFFSSMLLSMVLFSVITNTLTTERKFLFGLGTLSAVMGTTTGMGAPVLALIYQNERGSTVRANLALLYLISALIMLVGLLMAGKVNLTHCRDGLYLAPAYCAGLLISYKFRKHIDDKGYIRWCILMISAISAIILMIKSII